MYIFASNLDNLSHHPEFKKTKYGFGYSKRKGPVDRSKKNNPGPGMYESFS